MLVKSVVVNSESCMLINNSMLGERRQSVVLTRTEGRTKRMLWSIKENVIMGGFFRSVSKKAFLI